MKRSALFPVAVAMVVGFVLAQTSIRTDAEPTPQSAKDIRGASPYVEIKNEPAPKLIVDPPLPEGLAIGVVWIQYRVENLRIVPVFGEGATKNISAGWPSARHRRRPVLVVGGRERQQYNRHRRPAGREA
ncbi:MAG: DUF6130 family protein [Candidatus Manganitrophus sp.]|nr:MAG: DUF6130 family protein [Candidatus Manganitrophus sp.]